MRTSIVLVLAVVAGASFACNKSSDSSGEAPTPSAQPPAPTVSAQPAAVAPVVEAGPAREKVEITIGTVGETMAFDKTTLTVPTGAEVHLVIKNSATTAVMKHNWVLVNPGKEAAVALQGLKEAPDAGYVVPGPDVLAYTPLTEPKGHAEVTFTAPAPGKYPYICTYPGHYVVMKGVLTVTP